MSSNILEQSLDDIIGEKQQHQHQRKFIPSRRRGNPNFRRGGASSRGNRHHPYRSNPSNRRDTDSYIPRPSSFSSSSSVPKQVLILANGRPTLRIKNIHPELNGEDLSNLFSSISPVDFVKFDDDNDTIAYICFQNDCERSNLEAIEKFDGKKAMGKLLVVENTTSLLDRIDTRNLNNRIKIGSSLSNSSYSHPRGISSGRRPPRERKIGGRSARPAKKTAEDLDKELENYMHETTTTTEPSLEHTTEQVVTSTNDEMTLD